jgi:phosphatidate cytidylyltransferase
MFDMIPNQLVRFIPGVVEFCDDAGTIQPCVSGGDHYHHHFELQARVLPIQLHAITLAVFASLVAPFGGFMASGIKRAYNIKDFDSIIPGHGGVMDRMDCQFLMALCTWVHYNAFVKMSTVSVVKLLYLFKMLPEGEQAEFLTKAAEYVGK